MILEVACKNDSSINQKLLNLIKQLSENSNTCRTKTTNQLQYDAFMKNNENFDSQSILESSASVIDSYSSKHAYKKPKEKLSLDRAMTSLHRNKSRNKLNKSKEKTTKTSTIRHSNTVENSYKSSFSNKTNTCDIKSMIPSNNFVFIIFGSRSRTKAV